ncbi:MAG: hypothetical protein AUH85_02220 [Chloroflexi bacterium 13_1_40CM_4_68_4]|nr:MAG: hypothetical protein AUH85_02220 [Chloroflexi bacterium 13_1_40CM_4_68_4]
MRIEGAARDRSKSPTTPPIRNQERRADLVARYLVSLGYAEMRTEEEHAARPRYRVRFRWERLARWREPGE